MPLELVTVDEAKLALRFDDDAIDEWLELIIPSASEAVRSWLKDDWRMYIPERDSSGDIVVDSSGDPVPSGVVNPLVRDAVLLEIAVREQFRSGTGETYVPSHEGSGFILCRAATARLTGLRKPTVA